MDAAFVGSPPPMATPPTNLTPQIRRLLTLVQDGTTEHARLAATHLVDITETCSPVVLWDVLGCLQGFLSASRWRTRYNASLAMQGVARHLPASDQKEFLQQQQKKQIQQQQKRTDDSRESSDTDGTKAETERQWLTLSDCAQGKINDVVEKGQLLLSSSGNDWDPEEEDLERFDECYKNQHDFMQRRVQWQRRVLARRLGFSDVIQMVGTQADASGKGGGDLCSTFSSEDLLPPPAKRARHLERIQKRKTAELNGDADSSGRTSIRALLVLGMQRRELSTEISHRNPQTILATELIYRTFDPSWQVRHGSLLGILSLIRAWKVHRSEQKFGAWLHDILVRCLCVVSLDRFEDYSGAAVEGTGGAMAPVREMAGQVLSVIFNMTPALLQEETMQILAELSRRKEWEVRQGVQICYRYILTVVRDEASDNDGKSPQLVAAEICKVTIEHLKDDCDDVQSAAAQTLCAVFSDDGRSHLRLVKKEKNRVHIQASTALWPQLRDSNILSSSLVDMLSLFTLMVSLNCRMVLEQGGLVETSFTEILHQLLSFLESDSSALRTSSLKAISKLMENMSETCAPSVICLGELIEKYCHHFWCVNGCNSDQCDKDDTLKYHVWRQLISAFNLVSSRDEKKREALGDRIIIYYIRSCFLETKERSADMALAGHFLWHQMNLAHAISIFLTQQEFFVDSSQNAMFELCVSTFLSSPFSSHVQSACFLLREMVMQWRQSDPGSGSLPLAISRPLSLIIEKLRGSVCTFGSSVSALKYFHLWQESIGQNIKLVRCGKSDMHSAIKNVLAALDKSTSTSATIAPSLSLNSIRTTSTIACAIAVADHKSLPTKLTILIRALMTSLKNDSDEACQSLVSTSMATLLLEISLYSGPDGDKAGRFTRTSAKVFGSVCELASTGSEHSMACATKVLKAMIHQLHASKTLRDVSGLWAQLKSLPRSQEHNVEEGRLLVAVKTLGQLSQKMHARTTLAKHTVSSFIENLIDLACRTPSESIFSETAIVVGRMCELDSHTVLSKSIPTFTRILKGRISSVARDRSCEMLQNIVRCAGVNSGPYIRQLLPLSMQLMTDRSEVCAKTATEMFGSLVKIAPLTTSGVTAPFDRSGRTDEKSVVIDHLIQGKPLPPCVLPDTIAKSLQTSGTKLRQYQVEGISWLHFLQQMNLNGALCDSMGLGKTLQALVGVALSHHDNFEKMPKSLVICPTTVVGHWVREIEKYFGESGIFNVLSPSGGTRQRKEIWDEQIESSNLVVCSYAVLRSDITFLMLADWQCCILDEGHLLKNPKTATARAARKLRSTHRLILTGTPVQNKVDEVWATFDFLMPNFLGSFQNFRKEFSRPITRGQFDDASAEDIFLSMDKLRRLHQQVLPFLLRREKSEVLKELPPKIVTVIPCIMQEDQRRIYDGLCSSSQAQRALKTLKQLILQMNNTSRTEDSALGSEILKLLLVLRLACTHPCLVLGKEKKRSSNKETEMYKMENSAKLVALKQLLQDTGICNQGIIGADNDTSALYYGDDDDDEIDECETQGIVSPESESPAVLSNIEGKCDGGWSKCLVFAQFSSSLDVVEELLLKIHMPAVEYLRLDGRVPAAKRSDLVAKFNEDKDIRIMLISTKVGSLGLNLTGADTVVFLEPDWNPHTDLQSMDRAHRIGQTKTVNVFKLITADSIEERVLTIQEQKMKMSEAIVNTDNSSLYSLGTDRLLDIFSVKKHSQTTKHQSLLDKNLDALIDEYCEDYASLSIHEFIHNLAPKTRSPQL